MNDLDICLKYALECPDKYMDSYMKFAYSYFTRKPGQSYYQEPEKHKCSIECSILLIGEFAYCDKSQNVHACTDLLCKHKMWTLSHYTCKYSGASYRLEYEFHDYKIHHKVTGNHKNHQSDKTKMMKQRKRDTSAGSYLSHACEQVYKSVFKLTNSYDSATLLVELAMAKTLTLIIWHHIYHSDIYQKKPIQKTRGRTRSLRYTYKFTDHCIFVLYAHIRGIHALIEPNETISKNLPNPRRLNGIELHNGEYSISRYTPTRTTFMRHFINNEFKQLVRDSVSI